MLILIILYIFENFSFSFFPFLSFFPSSFFFVFVEKKFYSTLYDSFREEGFNRD